MEKIFILNVLMDISQEEKIINAQKLKDVQYLKIKINLLNAMKINAQIKNQEFSKTMK